MFMEAPHTHVPPADATAQGASPAVERISAFAQRFLPLRRLGWSFLLAWVFCVFYTNAVNGYLGSGGSAAGDTTFGSLLLYAVTPLLSTVVMLLLVVFGERRFGDPRSHMSLLLGAPSCAALGTPLLYMACGPAALQDALFAAGAVLTGIGSALMWILWGERHSELDPLDMEFDVPVSAILAILLVLTVSCMDGWLALTVTASFPVLSGLCLILAWHDRDAGKARSAEKRTDGIPDRAIPGPSYAETQRAREQAAVVRGHLSAQQTPGAAFKTMMRIGLGLFVACGVICVEETLWSTPDADDPFFPLMLLASAALVILVARTSTSSARRVNITFLFRWVCPLIVLGYAFMIWNPGGLGLVLARTTSLGTRFALCVITQLYFAYRAASGRITPVQAFGYGWLFVHAGDLCGLLAGIAFSCCCDVLGAPLPSICIGMVLLIVIATMVVMGEKDPHSPGLVPAAIDSAASPAQGGEEQDALSEIDVLRDAFEQRCDALAAEHGLTHREREVLALLGQGRSVPYIRDALVISKDTVSTHVKHIYAKLDVHSKQEMLDLFL